MPISYTSGDDYTDKSMYPSNLAQALAKRLRRLYVHFQRRTATFTVDLSMASLASWIYTEYIIVHGSKNGLLYAPKAVNSWI